MVNKSASPPYRVFLADTDLRLANLSNRFSQGPAKRGCREIHGKRRHNATAHFRPENRTGFRS
jgi:hypothetical protein